MGAPLIMSGATGKVQQHLAASVGGAVYLYLAMQRLLGQLTDYIATQPAAALVAAGGEKKFKKSLPGGFIHPLAVITETQKNLFLLLPDADNNVAILLR